MIRSKLPPIGPVVKGDLDGFNAHSHMPGYTGFYPGRKCKEYLLLKRADTDTKSQLEDLGMRYGTKLGPPEKRALKSTNTMVNNFSGKLRDPDLADWANHRKKSAITEYVRQAIRLKVNIKASGHGKSPTPPNCLSRIARVSECAWPSRVRSRPVHLEGSSRGPGC